MTQRIGNRRTVLVTDAHELAGLGAVRSLGRAGHTVIAGYPDGRRPPPAVRSRYCRGTVRYPDPWMQQHAFQRWLLEQSRVGLFDAVLPIAEPAVYAAAAVRSRVPSGTLTLAASDGALHYSLSKYHATAKALEIGVHVPATVFVQDGSGAPPRADLSELTFPVILKTDNHLSGDGIYVRGRRFIVQTPEAAEAVLREYRGQPIRMIAQEVIPGTGAGAFLLRFGGKVHMAFAHRRLHEIPFWGGYSSFRESCEDESLVAIASAMLEATDHDGVAMVEFRRSRDGRAYFLEINGRLWGSLALALHAGADFPKALLDCHTHGGPTAQPSYRSGIRCRNVFPGEVKHLRSILTHRASSQDLLVPSKIKALLRFVVLSCNPTIRHDHLWLTDPMPGVANAVRAARWLASESKAALIEGVKRFRDERTLRRAAATHRSRLARSSYFPGPMQRIAFLCYGNICRSAFAEHYWNMRLRQLSRTAPRAVSMGFHPEHDRTTPSRIADLAVRYGVDLGMHRSRVVDDASLSSVDAVFVMDRKNYRELLVRYPALRNRTYFLGWFGKADEIKDPYNMPTPHAARVVEELAHAIDQLLARLSPSNLHDAAQRPQGPASVRESAPDERSTATPIS